MVATLPAVQRDPFSRLPVCQAMTGALVIFTPDPDVARSPVRTPW